MLGCVLFMFTGWRTELVECSVCLGKVPNLKMNGKPLLYSDHMAISARFRLTSQEAASNGIGLLPQSASPISRKI